MRLGTGALAAAAAALLDARLGEPLGEPRRAHPLAALRARLGEQGTRTASLPSSHGLRPDRGCAFFQNRCDPDAQARHETLARCGALTRRFEQPSGLRFGLPGDGAGDARPALSLGEALHQVRR